jgi:hypothetical protein
MPEGTNHWMELRTFRSIVQATADEAKTLISQRAAAGLVGPARLCFKKSGIGQSGALKIVPEGEPIPEGYEDAGGDSLESNLPYDLYFDWISTRSTRLPILAIEPASRKGVPA